VGDDIVLDVRTASDVHTGPVGITGIIPSAMDCAFPKSKLCRNDDLWKVYVGKRNKEGRDVER
jgi:hypothetical protein